MQGLQGGIALQLVHLLHVQLQPQQAA
jgi:hypothetical protein